MITAQSRFNPVTKTLGKRAQFTVNLANRAHIMGILSGLYADPIKAVIRELCVNANESHKASGNKSPIKVTFPSNSGPTFIIKDEGLGLDLEDFNRLMASYGSSGEYKTTSNEYTGGFGLGCKAPAAYTDQWSVTCIKGGKKWVLVCFKDEFGVPSSDILEESDTDEPNGVEVKLPVKSDDIQRFRESAVEVFNVFRVKPTVSNATPDEHLAIHKVPSSFVLEHDNWRVTDPTEHTDSYVIMGDVKYPINYGNFKLPDDLSIALCLGITFDMEVGGLQVAPSREALMYTPMTVKRLTAEIKKVADNLAKVIEQRVQSSPTWWDACIAAMFLKNTGYNHNKLEQFLKLLRGKMLWRGQKVDGTILLPTVSVDGKKILHPDLAMVHCDWRSWGKNKLRQESAEAITVSRNVRVYLVPDKKSFRTNRLKHAFANDLAKGTVYVITTKVDWPVLCQAHPELTKIKYEDYNTLPEPPADTSGGGKSYDKNAKHTKGKAFQLDMDLSRYTKKESDHWKMLDSEYTEEDWWIQIEQFKPLGQIDNNDRLKRLIVRLAEAKLFTGRVLAKKKGDPLPEDAIPFETGLQAAVTLMFEGNQALGELVWRRVEYDLANHEAREIFHGYARTKRDEWINGELSKKIRASTLPAQHPAKKLVELLTFRFSPQVIALASLSCHSTSFGREVPIDDKIIDAFKPDDDLTLKHHSDILLRGWPMVRWATIDSDGVPWQKTYKASPTKDLVSYLEIIQKP